MSFNLLNAEEARSQIENELKQVYPLQSTEKLKVLRDVPEAHIDVNRLDKSNNLLKRIQKVYSNRDSKVLKYEDGQTARVNREQNNFRRGMLIEASSNNPKVVYPYYLAPAYRKPPCWLYLTIYRGTPSTFYITHEGAIYYGRHRFRNELFKRRVLFEGVLTEGHFIVKDVIHRIKGKPVGDNLIETRKIMHQYLHRDYQPDPLFEPFKIIPLPMAMADHYWSFVQWLERSRIPKPDGLMLRPIKRSENYSLLMPLPDLSERDEVKQENKGEKPLTRHRESHVPVEVTAYKRADRPDCYYISYNGSDGGEGGELDLLAVPDKRTSRYLATLGVSFQLKVLYSQSLEGWYPVLESLTQ